MKCYKVKLKRTIEKLKRNKEYIIIIKDIFEIYFKINNIL